MLLGRVRGKGREDWVTLLYLAAVTLASYKICNRLNAFTEESSKRTDMMAFLILGVIAIGLAMLIPQTVPKIEIGCGLGPCWSLA